MYPLIYVFCAYSLYNGSETRVEEVEKKKVDQVPIIWDDWVFDSKGRRLNGYMIINRGNDEG